MLRTVQSCRAEEQELVPVRILDLKYLLWLAMFGGGLALARAPHRGMSRYKL